MTSETSQPGMPAAEHVTARAASGARWAMLSVVWAAFWISFVDRLIWANVSTSVGASLGLSLASLNVFVTAFYTGYVLSNFGSGFLTDRLGGRLMLTFALIPLGAFTFFFGFTQSVAFGIVLQALMGMAAGADYAAGVKLITAWFGRSDRGRAMGLYMTAPTLGVIVTNAMVPAFARVFDWASIYQIFGVVTVATGVLCFFLLTDAPPRPAAESPLDKGMPRPSARQLLRNRNLVFLTFAGFGGMWGSFGFVFWVNALLVRGHGMSAIDAGSIVALFGVGALIGNPVMGFLSDWLGGVRRVPIVVCLVCFAMLLLTFGWIESTALFWVVAPVLGAAAFAFHPLLGAMVAESAGLALAGTATGVTNACWQLGTIVVPLVVGVVYQLTGSFLAAFATLAIGPLFAAACIWFTQERQQES